MTRHNTGPHGTASCRNGEKCFWYDRLDQNLSLKKKFGGKIYFHWRERYDLVQKLHLELENFRFLEIPKIGVSKTAKIMVFHDFSKNGFRYGFFRIFPITLRLVLVFFWKIKFWPSILNLDFQFPGEAIPPPGIMYRLKELS